MNSPTDSRTWTSRLTGWPAAAVVLAVFWLCMLASLRQKSLTFDEIGQVTAGYTYWRFNDYRLDPENGNLPQRVMALPLLRGGFRFPSIDTEAWRQSSTLPLADQWFHHMGNDLSAMLERGRAASGLMAVALGALVWLWSRRLFGPAGAMLSLGLFVLSPTILANGALMTSDTASALFFLAATLGWWAMLRRLSAGRVLLSAFAMGGLFVSKTSAPLIVPIALALLAARLIDGRPLPWTIGAPRVLVRRGRQAAALAAAAGAHVAIVALVIWASYGFRYSPFAGSHPGQDQLFTSWEHVTGAPVPRLLQRVNRLHLLPEAYLFGMTTSLNSAQGREAFLNGRYSVTGWRSFFPYTVLVKTPLPVFGVIALAAAATLAGWRARRRRDGGTLARQIRLSLHDTLPLWVLLMVYGGFFIFSHINIGHRHIMAAYPPAFVLCGAAAGWSRVRAARAALLALFVLLAAEVIYRFPDYLAYFNVIAGGPAHGYRHLVDSSLDWGQDLPGVERYLVDHHVTGPVYLSYFGTARPDSYQIRARPLYSYGFSMLDPIPPPVRIAPAPNGEVAGPVTAMLKEHPDFEFAETSGSGGEEVAIFFQKPAAFRWGGGTYFISATLLQSLDYDIYGPWGRWNERFEAEYQALRQRVRPFLGDDFAARSAALAEAPFGDWTAAFYDYERFRFARLAAYLRHREPDDSVGYSILVYRLTDADIARALDGPPPENGPDLLKPIEAEFGAAP